MQAASWSRTAPSSERVTEALSRRASSGPRPPRATSATSRATDIVFDAPTHAGRQRRARLQQARAGHRGRVRGAARSSAATPSACRSRTRSSCCARRGARRRATDRRCGCRELPDPRADRRSTSRLLSRWLAAAAFRLPRLGFPAEEIFDEVYHAKTALQYLQGESPTEWVHPPTAKLLIAIGVWVFGYESWAWRLLPALAGIALAPVFFLLARRGAGHASGRPLLATVLLLADGVYLVQSRTAMTNIFAVLFQVGAALLRPAGRAPRERLPRGRHGGGRALPRPRPLHALDEPLGRRVPGPACCSRLRGRRALRAPRAGARGRSPSRLIPPRDLRAELRALDAAGPRRSPSCGSTQGRSGATTPTCAPTHPYFSAWYTWPWLYRPTWYYFNQDASSACAGSWPSATPRCGGSRCRRRLWALVTGLRGARSPPALHRRRLLLPLPALGDLAAHAELQPLPLRGDPLRLPDPRPDPGPRTGTARRREAARGYVGATLVVMFLFFLSVPGRAARARGRVLLPTSGHGVRPWTWFPTWV